ncbi:MAG: MBL fold metallo-hydrolase [Candidatus Rifleibacteriota bacterium]
MNSRTARLGLVALAFLLICVTLPAADPVMQVTFLDVEQGDCTIIRTAEKTIMIDAGDDNDDAAKKYIIPYLKREGISHIDTAIITHPHRDHFGGFIELLTNVTFDQFYYSTDNDASAEDGTKAGAGSTYQTMLNLIKEKEIPYVKAKPGDKLDFGKGIKAEVLFCAEGAKSSSDVFKTNQNENSIILKVTADKISYLFPGDAEKNAEQAVIDAHSRKLKSTVLKSGHHGSRTSSTHAFLDLVEPEYATISVGEGNSFGHPNQEILDRYEYLNIKSFRTDKDGTIESFTDGKTIEFVTKHSPLEFAKDPEIISLTSNSATIQWSTNRAGTTAIEYGTTSYSESKNNKHEVKVHTVTLTGLKPETTYKFKAISRDPRETSKDISIKGTVTTPKGSGEPLPEIQSFATNYEKIYMKHPFKVLLPVFNPSEKTAKGFKIELYHSAMSPKNLIDKVEFSSLPADSAVEAVIATEMTWLGDVELIAILKKGDTIVDTASLNIKVNSKLFMVDTSHGNVDYYKGKFAGMKMDLYNEDGFQMKSIYKGITYNKIKDAFVVCIPHPEKDFTRDELAALKRYSNSGGSILMFCKADYRNLSNPDMLNDVLEVVGSKIRFNDDQMCDPSDNTGPPWRFFVSEFPTPAITGNGIKKLLTKSACSLVNSDYKALKPSSGVKLIAVGDDDVYNADVDEMNDGYIYASGSSIIPLAATEDLDSGRVACIGDQLYMDVYYNNPSDLDTIEFNRNITKWLSLSKEKSLKELLDIVASIDEIDDYEIKAERFENLSGKLLRKIRTKVENDPEQIDIIRALIAQHNSESIERIDIMFNQMINFDRMHNFNN